MKLEVGLQISEQEYRALDRPSYSLLSAIASVGPGAVHGERADISDMDGIIIGSIADSLVTEGKKPDGLEIIDKKPAAKALCVIKDLCSRTDLVDPFNVLSAKNKDIIDMLCKSIKYYDAKSAIAKVDVLKKYKKYADALQKYGEDAVIASKYQYREAYEISQAVFLRFPFVRHPEHIVGQVKLIGVVNGISIKGMLDFIYINHERKTVVPFDLKTGAGSHYEFFENGYLGWHYYIQSSLYRELLKQELLTHPVLKDYQVDNFRFMFCGRKDKLPIIYKVTDKQDHAGFTGFAHEKVKYPGISELLEDFVYYKKRPNATYRRGYDKSEVIFDDSYL